MLLDAQLPEGTTVKLPGIVPKLRATPGAADHPPPTLGQHTDEILANLGVDAGTRLAWRQRGII